MSETLSGPPPVRALTVRAVPPDEWAGLQARGVPYDLSVLDPLYGVVVVVEDGDRVVASWLALNTVHLEGLYIDPANRHLATVAGKLFAGMVEALQRIGTHEALTITTDPIVRAMAVRAGFEPVTGELFKLTIRPEET